MNASQSVSSITSCSSSSTNNSVNSFSSFDYLRPITGAQTSIAHIRSKNLTRPPINIINIPTSPKHALYSRKVFIGGLPPDIGENEVVASFQFFGNLIVDWPHKQETRSLYPPKGYAFLIFERDTSVQALISCCAVEKDKFYFFMSSNSVRDKPVSSRCRNSLEIMFELIKLIQLKRFKYGRGVWVTQSLSWTVNV